MVVLSDPDIPYSIYEEKIHPGWYFAPGVGFRFAFFKNLSATVQVDHRKLKYRKEEISNDISHSYEGTAGSFVEILIGLGYQF